MVFNIFIAITHSAGNASLLFYILKYALLLFCQNISASEPFLPESGHIISKTAKSVNHSVLFSLSCHIFSDSLPDILHVLTVKSVPAFMNKAPGRILFFLICSPSVYILPASA